MTDTKLEGSTPAAVAAAKQVGAKTGAEYAPGAEPLGEPTPLPDEDVNPISGVARLDEDARFDRLETAVVAIINDDSGAARRAFFGDADHGLHGRLADEPANPVPDVDALHAQADRKTAAEDAFAAALAAGAAGGQATSTAIESEQGNLAQEGAEAQAKADETAAEAAQDAADAAKAAASSSKKGKGKE